MTYTLSEIEKMLDEISPFPWKQDKLVGELTKDEIIKNSLSAIKMIRKADLLNQQFTETVSSLLAKLKVAKAALEGILKAYEDMNQNEFSDSPETLLNEPDCHIEYKQAKQALEEMEKL